MADEDAPSLYLVRHARAEPRDSWPGDDAERPLTQKGERQSEAIAGELGELRARPGRILSSPALRCRQTVAPLATRLGLEVDTVQWLNEGSDAYETLRMLLGAAGAGGGTAAGGGAVACTHGDVVWGVLERLAKNGVDLDPRPEAPKGGVWRLDLSRMNDDASTLRTTRAKLLLPGGTELHGKPDR